MNLSALRQLQMGKALRNVFWFTVAITAILLVAYEVLMLAGQDALFFIALAIAIVLVIWGLRTPGISGRTFASPPYALTGGKKYAKYKRRPSAPVGYIEYGPFEPAAPLASIPEDTYFIHLEHSAYQPHVGFEDLDDPVWNWCLFLPVGSMAAICFFGGAWWVIHLSLVMLINGTFPWAMLCLTLPAVGVLLVMGAVFSESVYRDRCTLKLRKNGLPLAGTILASVRKFTKDDRGHISHHIELQYVFTTPKGRQRTGLVEFRDDGGVPPQPGTPLVVLYADDDCHMPL